MKPWIKVRVQDWAMLLKLEQMDMNAFLMTVLLSIQNGNLTRPLKLSTMLEHKHSV